MAGPGDQVLNATLRLDLEEMRAQLETVKAEQAATVQRTERAEQKLTQARRQIEVLEPEISRLERKITATLRSSVRAGLGIAIGLSLESLTTDDGFGASLGRISAAAATGLIFSGGNLAAAGTLAASQAVIELSRGLRKTYEDHNNLIKYVRDLEAKTDRALAKLEADIASIGEAPKDRLFVEALKQREELKEMVYQASQHADPLK